MSTIQQELLRIASENGGVLKPEVVVASAAATTSPLHGCFQWDDTAAAHAYRLWQARQLIRVQVSVLPSTSVESRVFVSLSSDRTAGGGYREISAVLASDERYQELLADALREMEAFQAKYATIKELHAVIKAMAKVGTKAKAA